MIPDFIEVLPRISLGFSACLIFYWRASWGWGKWRGGWCAWGEEPSIFNSTANMFRKQRRMWTRAANLSCQLIKTAIWIHFEIARAHSAHPFPTQPTTRTNYGQFLLFIVRPNSAHLVHPLTRWNGSAFVGEQWQDFMSLMTCAPMLVDFIHFCVWIRIVWRN